MLICLGAGCAILVQWIGAQVRGQRLSLHRGLIGHTVFNPGLSGKLDNNRKDAASSFSYPPGRRMLTYSGGSEREGWNAKSNSGGEGEWIMSRTGGVPHVSASGSEVISADIVGLSHNPSTWPEAYVGVVHHEEYALASRRENGREARYTDSVDLANAMTNWWPSQGPIQAAPTPISRQAVGIWNYRFNRYNSGESYGSRIARGELGQLQAPGWAQNLSDDDLPEVIAISRAVSKETRLQWTRK